MHNTLSTEVRAVAEELTACRRALHQRPELSFAEHETTAFIEAQLRALGITDIDRPTKTGLVAHIFGSKPGKPAAVAVRADIDALPIAEDNDLPFLSQNPGVMHACGHDGHTAMLLSVAKLLSQSRGSFCGEARLIFQHAEELPPGGAIELYRAGASKGLDALLGLHLSSAYPTGVFGIKGGPLTANVDRFDVILTGRGGHCALPEQCIDPVVAGAQLVLSLQTVVSRRVGATDPAVLSVCKFVSGASYNIIPDEAQLSGTIRSFSPQTRAHMEAEIRRITEGVAMSTGTRAQMEWTAGYPSVFNDAALTTLARSVLHDRFGEEGILDIACVAPGEDFSYFLADAPGFFVELGTRTAAGGCDMPHHNPRYRMDESALPRGVQFELDMLRKLLDGTRENLPERSPSCA
ncbi:MAG: amidohydrolase [Clostridia bacterium]|nr:amidohydrolase [Clostridia bacterium]